MLRRTSTRIAGMPVDAAGSPISTCQSSLTQPPSLGVPVDDSTTQGLMSSSRWYSNDSPYHQPRAFTGCVMQHSSSDPTKFYISESSNDPDLCRQVRKANLQRKSSADGDQWLECTDPIRPDINQEMHFTVDPIAVYRALLIPTATPVSMSDMVSTRPAYRGRVRQHSNSDCTKFYVEELSKDTDLRQAVGDAREVLGRLGSVKAIQWLEATAATSTDRPAIDEEVEFEIDDNDVCKAIVTRRMRAESGTIQNIQAREQRFKLLSSQPIMLPMREGGLAWEGGVSQREAFAVSGAG